MTEEDEDEEADGEWDGDDETDDEEDATAAAEEGSKDAAKAVPEPTKLPEWAPSVLPLLRDGYEFEEIGIGGLDSELSQLFRRVVTPRLVPASLRDALNLQLVRGVLREVGVAVLAVRVGLVERADVDGKEDVDDDLTRVVEDLKDNYAMSDVTASVQTVSE